MNKANIFIGTLIVLIVLLLINFQNTNKLPIIAIANWGPHSSLDATVAGIKEQMAQEGYADGKNIKYETVDVGFDPSLIPQMISSLRQHNPKVMVVISTPVAQFAKGTIHDIPLVYSAITDPAGAGLIKEKDLPDGNMTGSSEKQDLEAFIQFVKLLLPSAKNIGLLYSTAESNDAALVKMMQTAAAKFEMNVVTIPIEQARDVAIRVREFKDRVDLIYVGTSGPIQPTLPVIALEAGRMHIPLFNADEQAVRDGLALASFGVSYEAVGRKAGSLVAALLKGKDIKELKPTYPVAADHHGVVNRKKALEFGVPIPPDAEVVE